jgi:hypothetical protein
MARPGIARPDNARRGRGRATGTQAGTREIKLPTPALGMASPGGT